VTAFSTFESRTKKVVGMPPFVKNTNGLQSPPIHGIYKWGRRFGMATPGQLVQVMADTLGISKPTVIQYDRLLAENGLRSRSGRGTSAAKVTSRDAAHLLIALAASPIFGPSVRNAARNCQVYASLRNVKGVNWSKNFVSFGLPTLDDLPFRHSFGEALSALIDATGRGEVFKLPTGERCSLSTLFEIRFLGPTPGAQILVDGTKDFGLLAKLMYPKILTKTQAQKIPDLRRISIVGFRTIHALGALVSGGAA
jgi:hypothetical protein